ncbi:MAG: putative Ribosome biogenesis ATPase RIX7 [Streblomastix strix]|uniref:Putative Ribosome biogenesis ATPase RIX7 n=1 Tax=Streblomastix strix TaxID=222440 RepID=A0A5J4VGP9_9EUKA|nr:MAG: putative Ribosome biogenesis ATPase RIX7 [Streblomastix strix]
MKDIQPISKREGFDPAPNVSFDDVGAMMKAKEKMKELVRRIKNPQHYTKYGLKNDGILLYGPPGCGKTLLAKAFASQADASFISISGPSLLNKYVGASEQSVRSIFERARIASPCVIFFDEIDALVPKRQGSENNHMDTIVNQILAVLDGVKDREAVYVIGATNRLELIDEALLRSGRLGTHIEVGLPNEAERKDILKVHTKNIEIIIDQQEDQQQDSKMNLNQNQEQISPFDQLWERIKLKMNGFSGADIASLVQGASLKAINKMIENDERETNQQMDKDFDEKQSIEMKDEKDRSLNMSKKEENEDQQSLKVSIQQFEEVLDEMLSTREAETERRKRKRV